MNDCSSGSTVTAMLEKCSGCSLPFLTGSATHRSFVGQGTSTNQFTGKDAAAGDHARFRVSRTLPVVDFDWIRGNLFGPLLCWLIAACSLSGLLVFEPNLARAQERDQGKEIVKGLLRALVESQLDRTQDRADLRHGPRNIPQQATPEIERLRPLMAELLQELSTLTALLNTDARRSFEIRRGLADALRVQAVAVALKQRTDRERDHLPLLAGFQELNSEWKTLAHQLLAAPGISAPTRQCIQRVDKLDRRYTDLLKIEEQFDSRELVRAADALAAEFRVLADEISYAAGPPAGRARISAALRRLRDRTQILANMASAGIPFRSVVSEYQSLYQAWQQIRAELNQFSNRTVVRSLGRVEESHQLLHRLLRLDFGMDQTLLLQLAQGIQQDLSELYRSITLEQMMALREQRAIAMSADALAGSAENLTDLIVRGENMTAIGEASFFLDEAWRVFEHYLEPVQTPEIRRRVDGVRQSLELLKNGLGMSVDFDRKAVSQQASSVNGIADRLMVVVRRWQSRPGVSDASLLRDVEALAGMCETMQNLCSAERGYTAARAKCDETMAVWQRLRPLLLNCNSDEKGSIEGLADGFTRELVRLKMMLGDS